MKKPYNAFRQALTLCAACLVALSAAKVSRAQGDQVVATVNNDIITAHEFYDRLQRMRGQDFILQGGIRQESSGQIMLSSLISERLIMQTAAKENVAPTDADIDDEYKLVSDQPNIKTAIEKGVVTVAALKYDIRVNRSRFNLATSGITLKPDEAEAYYNAHIQQYTIPQKWTIAIIRTTKETDVDRISADIKAGKPFEELVKTYSEDQNSKAKDGVLGSFYANDPGLPAPIQDAIKPLKVGSVSDAVKFDLDAGPNKPKIPAWWFVKLVDSQSEKIRLFPEVKVQVERVALLDKAKGYTAADAKIADFRKSSEIKVSLAGYDGMSKSKDQ